VDRGNVIINCALIARAPRSVFRRRCFPRRANRRDGGREEKQEKKRATEQQLLKNVTGSLLWGRVVENNNEKKKNHTHKSEREGDVDEKRVSAVDGEVSPRILSSGRLLRIL